MAGILPYIWTKKKIKWEKTTSFPGPFPWLGGGVPRPQAREKVLGTRLVKKDWTHEQKMDFEGLTQNGCYGNQPQSFAPFYKTRFDRQTSISAKFQFCSVM